MSEELKQGELEINSTEELNDKLGELTKDPSLNKPTDEEVELAQKDFEEAAKEWQTKVYQIGEPEDALEFCNYIQHFLRSRYLWQKDAWMGVIKLTEELEEAEKLISADKEKPLELGYQALEFTYFAFSNLGGVGLEAAKAFEAEAETFVKVATKVEEILEDARKALKEVEFLQQRWGAMAQGFYLEMEPEEEAPENMGVTEGGIPIHPDNAEAIAEELAKKEEAPE